MSKVAHASYRHLTTDRHRSVARDYGSEGGVRNNAPDRRNQSGMETGRHYGRHYTGHAHYTPRHHRPPSSHGLFQQAIDAFKRMLGAGTANVNPAAIDMLRSIAQQGILPAQVGMGPPPMSIGQPGNGFQIPPGVPSFADRQALSGDFGGGFIGQPGGFNPAQSGNVDLVNQIANAPLFSPDEAALMKNLPPEQQAMMTLQAKKQRESLMTSVLTNITNMKHEQLKAIAGNLRG